MTATLLLTRPLAQSQAFARFCRHSLGRGADLRTILSPLQRIDWLSTEVDSQADSLIFSSQNGVLGFRRLAPARGRIAYCVGEKTTELARRQGFQARCLGPNAQTFLQNWSTVQETGRVLHACGGEVRVDLAAALGDRGVAAKKIMVYQQRVCPLTPQVRAVLRRGGRIVAPQFSPRSAKIFCRAVASNAAIVTPCLSPAVKSALSPGRFGPAPVLSSPTAPYMVQSVAQWLQNRTAA